VNIVGKRGEPVKVPLVAFAWKPSLLWVNKNGQRFITEGDAGPFNGGNAVAIQPENLVPVRTPPFYPLKCSSAFLDTIGGIKINEQMEVISQAGNPISGLYAAGVITGGWQDEPYCAQLLGSARGFALNSGRIAGKSAAEFLRSAFMRKNNASDAP